MRDLDLKLLRLMRTRGHTPALERAAKLLGKAGNNGAGWLVAGAALAAADKPRRSAWGVAAALGPAAIGLNYGVKLVGIDHVGLGSDFDGVSGNLPEGLRNVADYPNLIAALQARGYADEDLKKILGGNLLRVWSAVEAGSARAGR